MPVSQNRPQRYRSIKEVYAFMMDDDNGKEVALWCGGRFVPESKNGAVTTRARVDIPTFNEEDEIAKQTAYVGSLVIKKDDGTHEVWTRDKMLKEGYEPFRHRTTRNTEQLS